MYRFLSDTVELNRPSPCRDWVLVSATILHHSDALWSNESLRSCYKLTSSLFPARRSLIPCSPNHSLFRAV